MVWIRASKYETNFKLTIPKIQAHTNPIHRVQEHGGRHRLSLEKEEDEEQQTASGSGSSNNGKDEEKSERWHGQESDHVQRPKAVFVQMHVETESEAVRE